MPIQIKYKKLKFGLTDFISTIDGLLAAMTNNSELSSQCPQTFTLYYEDQDGDQISVLKTEDLTSFLSGQSQTLTLVEAKSGNDTLSIHQQQTKSLDQLVQEQMERQLALSVSKFENEMHQKVRQIVEQETKDFLSQSQFLKQEKQQPKPKSDKLPQIFDIIQPQLQQLQKIQDLLLDLEDNKKASKLLDNFEDTFDELKKSLKNHIKEVRKFFKMDKDKGPAQKIEKELKASKACKKAPKKEVDDKIDAPVPEKPWKKKKQEKIAPQIIEQLIEANTPTQLSDQQQIQEQKVEVLSEEKIEGETLEKNIQVDLQSNQFTPLEGIKVEQDQKILAVDEPQFKIEVVPQIIEKVQPPITKQLPEEVNSNQSISNLKRSQAIASMFGFDQSIVLALIRESPSLSDDHIANQLFDQFK